MSADPYTMQCPTCRAEWPIVCHPALLDRPGVRECHVCGERAVEARPGIAVRPRRGLLAWWRGSGS